VLGENRKERKDIGDVRRVFEETFDVVHGDESGGRGGDDDNRLVVTCKVMELDSDVRVG